MLTNKSTLIMARLQAMQCRRKLTRKGSCLNALLFYGPGAAAVLQCCRVASAGQTAGAPFKL